MKMNQRDLRPAKAQLQEALAAGEDSRRQFVLSVEALSSNVTAMANSGGGEILVGVAADGRVQGLDAESVRQVNRAVSRLAASAPVPLTVLTRNVLTPQGVVVMIHVDEVLSTLCPDEDGVVWLRSGAGRRRLKDGETLERLLRGGTPLELQPLPSCRQEDADESVFRAYVAQHFPELLKEQLTEKERMQRLGLVRDGWLTAVGAMLFDRYAVVSLPWTAVLALVIPGDAWSAEKYAASDRIEGTVSEQVAGCLAFLRRHAGGGARELAAMRELLLNALIHRTLMPSFSHVKLFVFCDRVEIRSPGGLPEGQTMEGLRAGVKVPRNPLLAQHAARLLGKAKVEGIPGVLKTLPGVIFDYDAKRLEFTVTVPRPSIKGCRPSPVARGDGYALRVARVLEGEMSRSELQAVLGIKSRPTFARCFLKAALEARVIEMTLPESPRSKRQKYRLTEKGRQMKQGDEKNESQ